MIRQRIWEVVFSQSWIKIFSDVWNIMNVKKQSQNVIFQHEYDV